VLGGLAGLALLLAALAVLVRIRTQRRRRQQQRRAAGDGSGAGAAVAELPSAARYDAWEVAADRGVEQPVRHELAAPQMDKVANHTASA
jgi:hypothetical protein